MVMSTRHTRRKMTAETLTRLVDQFHTPAIVPPISDADLANHLIHTHRFPILTVIGVTTDDLRDWHDAEHKHRTPAKNQRWNSGHLLHTHSTDAR